MRQLQKGNQTAQRSGCRWNWFSRVLILRTLWKTDHRVPEERQASSAQDDRITAPSDSARTRDCKLTQSLFIFALLLNERCGANSFVRSWCSIAESPIHFVERYTLSPDPG